jgi:hypothetical protein
MLAAIPYPSEYADVALAIGTRYIYYAADLGEGSSGQYLGRVPIPARCSAQFS